MTNTLDSADDTGKFRFYIVETDYGDVRGTNSELMAKAFAHRDDAFVIDTHEVKWWATPLKKVEVTDVEG